jgi:deazaflavin-dependent oxidoreductase (nitroreductase family)
LLYRLPIALYRWRMGWLLGKRFVLVEHVGRRTGLTRYTVLEVVNHDPTTGAVLVASGWGRRSDWFRNVMQMPEVALTVGTRRFAALAEILGEEEASRETCDYARRHPLAFRALAKLVLGDAPSGRPWECGDLGRAVPMLRFTPVVADGR